MTKKYNRLLQENMGSSPSNLRVFHFTSQKLFVDDHWNPGISGTQSKCFKSNMEIFY